MITQLICGMVATICVHEAGHTAAAIALRLPWRPVITRRGVGICIGRKGLDLMRWQVRITAISGPLFNVLLALICAQLGLGVIAAMNILFAIANLLPLPHSDGTRLILPGRAIRLAREAEAAR